MRDIPRFVELLDKGQFNARALATSVVPIEKMLDAYQEVAYRTTVTAIMTACRRGGLVLASGRGTR